MNPGTIHSSVTFARRGALRVRVLCAGACVGLLFVSTARAVRATQDPPPVKPSQPPTPTDPAPTPTKPAPAATEQAPTPDEQPAPLPVDQAIQRAVAALDRMEAGQDAQQASTEIEELYKTIQQADPNNVYLFYIQGRRLILAGRAVDGTKALERFAASRPGQNDWQTWRILGDAYLKEFPRLAEPKYRRALLLNDHEPTILLGLSAALSKQGRRDEAVQLAKRAVEVDGRRSVRYLSNYATLLRANAKPRQAAQVINVAIALARQAVEKQPGDPAPLRVLVAQYEIALLILRDVLRATPDDASAYASVAQITERLADARRLLRLHEVITLFENTALTQLADDVPIDFRLSYARLLNLVGRTEDARRQYQLVLSADPENAAAHDALSDLPTMDKTGEPPPAGK